MKNKKSLSNLTLVNDIPSNLVDVSKPFLVTTNETFRKALEQDYQEAIKEFGDKAEGLNFLQGTKGSTPFIVGLVNKLLVPYGLRTPTCADDKNNEIFQLIEGNHWMDYNDLIIRSAEPTYDENKKLLQDIIEMTEQKQGSIKFPFKISGLYTIAFPEDSEQGYGLKFEPAPNFMYVHDERLDGEKYPTGIKFNNFDDSGIIVPAKNGKFTWYTKKDGLSGVYRDRDGDANSDDGDLSDQDDFARVVLMCAEGARHENFEDEDLIT